MTYEKPPADSASKPPVERPQPKTRSRVLTGAVTDSGELYLPGGVSQKVSGIYRMLGRDQTKLGSAKVGDTVIDGTIKRRLEQLKEQVKS